VITHLTKLGAAFCAVSLFVALPGNAASPAAREFTAGTAQIDITPEYPVRLSGYGNRTTVSQGVGQRIWAKALAMQSGPEALSILLTVDNCAVSGSIADQVCARLKARGLSRERFALCSTHTHSAPCLSGVIPNLFSKDIAPEEQAAIDRYTRELVDRLEQVSVAALADLRPAQLAWASGQVDFARNRRPQGGPVDHTLSLLRVADSAGRIRALLANYACHCTTLQGQHNVIHGDWAGCAQLELQKQFPGAVAIIAIGCGADSNPSPRGRVEDAENHGRSLAAEVRRLLDLPLRPLSGPIQCQNELIQLPFQTHFTRAQWEERGTKGGIVGYHARKNLARLDRGETLPRTLPYLVQTWVFGDALAMVFLPGEVVVDYALRLKREADASRLWINAYANDVPCYIPSRRILQEGGYEAEDSLWYYDRPARLAPECEDLIIQTVRKLLPQSYSARQAAQIQ
jgi:hypothetical protein